MLIEVFLQVIFCEISQLPVSEKSQQKLGMIVSVYHQA